MTADLTMIDPVLRDVMLSGGIKALMPLSCLKEGDRVTGIYSTTDKVMVSEGRFSPVNVLELTGRILRMTDELKDWLLYPQEMVLNTKVIFIDPDMRHTRICVIPVSSEKSEKENVSYLLDEIKELTDEKGRAYMDAFIRIYLDKPRGINALLSILEDMKKEAGME